MEPSAAICVFARAPLPGATKTRLAPALGPVKAAELHARLLWRTLEETRQVPGAETWLVADSPASRDWFAQHFPGTCHRLTVQPEGDLGVRMQTVLNAATAEHGRALLIGSDVIDFCCDDLEAALAALQPEKRLALGPAADGGYWLIGAAAAVPATIFAGIHWGTPTVFSATLQRVREAGWTVHLARRCHDIDEPSDLMAHAAAIARLVSPPRAGGTAGSAPAR